MAQLHEPPPSALDGPTYDVLQALSAFEDALFEPFTGSSYSAEAAEDALSVALTRGQLPSTVVSHFRRTSSVRSIINATVWFLDHGRRFVKDSYQRSPLCMPALHILAALLAYLQMHDLAHIVPADQWERTALSVAMAMLEGCFVATEHRAHVYLYTVSMALDVLDVWDIAIARHLLELTSLRMNVALGMILLTGLGPQTSTSATSRPPLGLIIKVVHDFHLADPSVTKTLIAYANLLSSLCRCLKLIRTRAFLEQTSDAAFPLGHMRRFCIATYSLSLLQMLTDGWAPRWTVMLLKEGILLELMK
ncbi:hypothetical protein CYLTODRAFT_478520, partial [Cylindrobasidium torrendii FP15055 ss-10]